MSSVNPIKLADYKEPNYLVKNINITFTLDNCNTLVESEIHFYLNENGEHELELFGENLKLENLSLDGTKLEQSRYIVTEKGLIVHNCPERGVLKVVNTVNPEANKTMEGLYKSGGIFCTQCEPEGFRTITYYPDRPDVMTKFTTKIIADKAEYPILLSNGNPIAQGDLEGGKHFVTWEDPFAKPAYLFALVAGDLGMVSDTYTTSISSKEVKLEIYCDKGNESKCYHALESLKNSMRWDEERFGLEYDLDIYMIVAVDSFNMGAMENKGLNIFNSKFVLANKESATDSDFLGVEGVIGHEYFHNWTGNRVTCKNWFQLTLKEGLTVFRDQEFSADMMNAHVVKRIDDVTRLKQSQFVEDAGPTSHPIKPKEYIEMNNFYTATVYEKGAEIIRMIETFLGREGFRKGMDLYFARHDGQAVTTEDFISAMSDANGNYDFSQFETWYHRSGTPTLNCSSTYDEVSQTFILKVEQDCKQTVDVASDPFHLPLKMGLLNSAGNDLQLELDQADDQPQLAEGILHIRKDSESFIFKNIMECPTISLNRGFKAPVIVAYKYSFEELAFLMANDSDHYNRYESMQQLSKLLIGQLLHEEQNGRPLEIPAVYFSAFDKLLQSELKPAVKAYCMTIPAISLLKIEYSTIDFAGLNKVRNFLRLELSTKFEQQFLKLYAAFSYHGEFKLDAQSIGQRMLKNRVLGFLSELISGEELMLSQFDQANNMTDEISALGLIANSTMKCRNEKLDVFLKKWNGDKLVVDKWFTVQAMSTQKDTLKKVKQLLKHKLFDATNPNSMRAIVGSFIGNYTLFHDESGAGYKFAVDQIISIDKLNPQVASRFMMGFRDYQKLPESLKDTMGEELKRLKSMKKISKNTSEILNKILG